MDNSLSYTHTHTHIYGQLFKLDVYGFRPGGEDEAKSDVMAARLAEAGFYFTGLNDSVQGPML